MPGGTLGGPPPHRSPPWILALALVLAALLAGAAAPGALAEGEFNLPPKETGLGPGDVDDEPSRTADENGFPHTDYSPNTNPHLVLDAHYLYEPFPFDVAVNSLVEAASEGAGFGPSEKHMYPGFGYFEAWWGWWWDRGSNARLSRAAGAGAPDGAIQDAHDDPGTWDGTTQDPAAVHHGSWDEFVWRGDNPWAGDPDHPFAKTAADLRSRPDDRMLLFIDPGTHQRHARQMILPGNPNSAYILRNDKDPADVPDMAYADHTDQGPYSGPGVPNDGGWDMVNNYPTGTYDAGVLVTTRAETSVNPAGTGPTYEAADAEAYDVDYYTAVSPLVEDAYRTAVWDPKGDHGDAEDEENVFPFHEEGPKGYAKDVFTDAWVAGPGAAVDPADQLTEPVAPVAGLAEDAAGGKAWRHEPNRDGDVYGVGEDTPWARHDPGTTYGAMAGDSTDYYEPGPGHTYDGYVSGEHAWLDAQAGWGVPIYGIQFRLFGTFNLRPVQAPASLARGGAAPGLPPGVLGVSAHFGTWYDANGDTWVGNVSEQGRWSSREDPYNHGLGNPADAPDDPFYHSRGDDPNDYTDTPSTTASDPTKHDAPEWRPLCGGGTVHATLVPRTDGQRWGSAGVYVLEDGQERSNPYDDALRDAAGEFTGDEDPRSRHRMKGPIDVDLVCRDDATGLHMGDAWIASPTGTADYPVEVRVTGEVGVDRTSNWAGNKNGLLRGETVRDVDVLGSLQGE